MTLRELLKKISDEKPNSFSNAKLISYVNEVEAEVAEDLRLESAPVYTDSDVDLDTELLAHAPYDNLYTSYVKAKIDFANEEYDSYSNNQAQHVQDYKDFFDWVVRTGQAARNTAITRFRNIMW